MHLYKNTLQFQNTYGTSLYHFLLSVFDAIGYCSSVTVSLLTAMLFIMSYLSPDSEIIECLIFTNRSYNS